MKSEAAIVLLFIVLLAACTSGRVEIVTPLSTMPDPSTETAIVPGMTSTLAPTETASPTFEPVNTVPVATRDAIATTEATRNNLVSQFPELEEYNTFCNVTYCYGVELSPNGQWIYLSNGNVIEIFETSGKRVGKYSFHEIYGYRIDYYEGIVEGVHWSRDGRYLYIATRYGDGGPGPYFGYKSSLARVNLQNGTWKDTGISGVLSFAPNEKYIGYSTNLGEVRVRNFQSGEEQIYITPNPYWYFGEFVWSPNAKKVIFVATSESLDESYGKFALCMIDLKQGRIHLLHEDFMPFYYPVAWTEENQVSLRRYQEDGIWTLDLAADPPIISP